MIKNIIFSVLSVLWLIVSLVISSVLGALVYLGSKFNKRLSINLTLAIVAYVLSIGLFPIGFLYSLLSSNISEVNKYLFKAAISLDQSGNSILDNLFNNVLLKKNPKYSYGDPDKTISYATGKAVINKDLSLVGKGFNYFLNVFEKDHAIRSVTREESDV